MISFDSFSATEGTPIYLQILMFIKRGAVAGSIVDGDELPSRRVLSALLGINPNTVQRAFALLEEEGLIESRSGAKSYMKLGAEKLENLRENLLKDDIKGITKVLKQMGITKLEALKLIDSNWDSDDQ